MHGLKIWYPLVEILPSFQCRDPVTSRDAGIPGVVAIRGCLHCCLLTTDLSLFGFSAEIQLPPGAQEFQGLWQSEVVSLYVDILKESSNPVTVEAAAGAIQNLTACYWKVGISCSCKPPFFSRCFNFVIPWPDTDSQCFIFSKRLSSWISQK